ncbi:hypothetical protein NFI96_000100 [Prochilodus magdalenae]|nr:hypothetical protein NFI96_000100 [Prochilodus magdalenae]
MPYSHKQSLLDIAVYCPNIEDPANGTIICSGDSYNNGSSSFNDGFYLQSAQWGQGMPYCEGVQFSILTEPFYGSMQYYHPLGCPAYQSSCEFASEDGYMLTDSGSGQLMYEATGDWNNSQATCEVLLDPANGRIICSGDIYTSSNIFSCNDGFHLQGAPELSCSDPAHSYQEVPYYEVVQRCALSEPYHSPMLYNHAVGSSGYQSSSELTCEEGCTLTGPSFSQLMFEATAYWNDSQPTYEAVHCPYIEDPANGTILCSGDSYNNRSSSFNDGFYLQSAQWGQGMPYCEGVQFSVLTEPFYGSMQYYHPLGCPAFQSSCEFTCDSGSGQLMYEGTGDWNNSRATCEAVCYPVIVDPANGQIICSGDIYTSSNIFSCNDGFHLQRAPEVTCYKSAQWTQEVPYCEGRGGWSLQGRLQPRTSLQALPLRRTSLQARPRPRRSPPAEVPAGPPAPAEVPAGPPAPAEVPVGPPVPAEVPAGAPEEVPAGPPAPVEDAPNSRLDPSDSRLDPSDSRLDPSDSRLDPSDSRLPP